MALFSGFIPAVFRLMAHFSKKKFSLWETSSLDLQQKVFNDLMASGIKTQFGKEHGFAQISDYDTFKKQVPIRDYEAFKPYIEQIFSGQKDVLWPGQPLYFAKTSGTTSGTKYIPLTRQSVPNHIDSARNALLMYILKTGKTKFLKGKFIFLSGSPELEKTGDILTGRLSGIVQHHIPFFIRNSRLPSFETNCIEDWETKLAQIVNETATLNMSLISGIPPWLVMYFEKLLDTSKKKNIAELFPGFSLLVHGGVNFQPYRDKLFSLIGREIDVIETYPASEGFIAFQDECPSKGLVLIPDGGIFYEFIPADRYFDDNPPRLSLSEVKTGVNYALIINNNAGLWGYSIGDTVQFESINPYRLKVTGRLSQYTSAFGEHVIATEAEAAIIAAAHKTGAIISEFTLAPLINNPQGKPCHQWFVAFEKEPAGFDHFATLIDQYLQEKNTYYKDLIAGNILQQAMVVKVPEKIFRDYMKSIGKLGGQNKIPHLSNHRDIADWILKNIS